MLKFWQRRTWQAYLLWPFSLAYRAIVFLRRLAYRLKIFKSHRFNVPIIVVGNLTVGGVGKTPLVTALAHRLKAQGFKPGLVSRGYRGQAKVWPQVVTPQSDPRMVGDEPVMLAMQMDCPMVVAPDRVVAVALLLDQFQCDIVISDDGLQHYALERDVEICVIDGKRRLGNGFCLPAGPLREPVSRLKSVTFMVSNGGAARPGEYQMQLEPQACYQLSSPSVTKPLAQFAGACVHAVAGIGHPQRFFTMLRAAGLEIIEHPFPDHHDFILKDLQFSASLPILMTAKDAVKCRHFTHLPIWVVPVIAQLSQKFIDNLSIKIRP